MVAALTATRGTTKVLANRTLRFMLGGINPGTVCTTLAVPKAAKPVTSAKLAVGQTQHQQHAARAHGVLRTLPNPLSSSTHPLTQPSRQHVAWHDRIPRECTPCIKSIDTTGFIKTNKLNNTERRRIIILDRVRICAVFLS